MRAAQTGVDRVAREKRRVGRRQVPLAPAAERDADRGLVVGADILAEAQRWYRFDAIEKLAPLIVLGRVGFDTPRAPLVILPDVSSTYVRTAVARGAWNELEGVVPRSVVEHIRARKLYGAPT